MHHYANCGVLSISEALFTTCRICSPAHMRIIINFLYIMQQWTREVQYCFMERVVASVFTCGTVDKDTAAMLYTVASTNGKDCKHALEMLTQAYRSLYTNMYIVPINSIIEDWSDATYTALLDLFDAPQCILTYNNEASMRDIIRTLMETRHIPYASKRVAALAQRCLPEGTLTSSEFAMVLFSVTTTYAHDPQLSTPYGAMGKNVRDVEGNKALCNAISSFVSLVCGRQHPDQWKMAWPYVVESSKLPWLWDITESLWTLFNYDTHYVC